MRHAIRLVISVCSWPAATACLISAALLAQTADELVRDGQNPANVTTQSLGYHRRNYSPLKQISPSTVKRLVPVWSSSLMNDLGELAAPAVYDGVLYAINGKWTFAIDVETGRQIWRPVSTSMANVHLPLMTYMTPS